jgi:FkbM family methyltransferase
LIKKLNKLFRLSWGEIILLTKDIVFTKHDENIIRLIRLVKKLVPDAGNKYTIIDIGAFDGTTSVQFQKSFPACKVLAFEPNAEAFKVAERNIKPYPGIILKNIAISDKSGKAKLNVTLNSVSSSLNQINTTTADPILKEQVSVVKESMVATQTLDELKLSEKILILKIDVQGHEKEVISGGKNTLKNTGFILIEMNNHDMYSGSSKYYEIDSLLRENNFNLIDIIVTYRKGGLVVSEYDAIYHNRLKYPQLT